MTSPRTRADLEARYFGRGAALDPTEPDSLGIDIAFADGSAGRDVAFRAGAPNLAQDLRIALLTPTGSDVFNAAFGFDGLRVLTEGHSATMAAEMLRLAVLKTVALDPRIKRVLDLTIAETEPGSRRYRVDCQIQTRIGDIVRMTIGDVDGGSS